MNRSGKYMDSTELSVRLRLPENLIDQLAAGGHIPGEAVEGRWRFLKSDIDAWLQAGRERLAEDIGVPHNRSQPER